MSFTFIIILSVVLLHEVFSLIVLPGAMFIVRGSILIILANERDVLYQSLLKMFFKERLDQEFQ
ncbi:MAG: hypothetical protein HGA59_00630 [Chlorobiaceae bacterium]|nr:hypothetical protein [Chlorobiaceae bacterium]NTV15955.1 hypothetical protein [Chlorobiaceae bacterium]